MNSAPWPSSTYSNRSSGLESLCRNCSPISVNDPASFIRTCLTDAAGQPIRVGPLHERLQRFLTNHRRALVELPRDHGKTTQVLGRILWELGRNPGLRIKIICATDAIAHERSRYLRDQIDGNGLLRQVFPCLVRGRPWTAEAFTVARAVNVVGPSVAAFGVGAAHTGTRADLLVCDDVVDVRSLHSKAERERVADYFFNNLMNLLEPDGRFWGLFTPWHHDDLNARLKKNGAYAHFREAVGANFEPVWPEKWPTEALRARHNEIGTASFARGYRLVPVAEGETAIRPAWVRYWREPAEYEQVVLAVDPAVSTAERADRSALVVLGKVSCEATRASLSSLRPGEPATSVAGLRLDPATDVAGSPGVLGAYGHAAPQIRVLAARAAQLSAPDLVALIDHFDRAWNPAVILFESNAAFRGIRDLLARHTRFGPRLKGVTQSADKSARVAAFSVVVENGALRLLGNEAGDAPDESQRELYEEMIGFPFDDRDDLVDAAAMGTAYLLEHREPRIW